MTKHTAFLVSLMLSAGLISSVQAQGPQLPSCGNISFLADSTIDGTEFTKGIYQLNTFGISCEEVVGINGILGFLLRMSKDDRLPSPWYSLKEAIGAPKFSKSAAIGIRLQKIDDLPSTYALQEQQLQGMTTRENVGSGAIFKIGASSDSGLTSKQNFSSTDSVYIGATIIPRVEDQGRPADIYVVAEIMGDNSVFMQLNRYGQAQIWNGAIDGLSPVHTVNALAQELRFQIYSGKLDAAFRLAIYIGYATATSDQEPLIHYNSTPYIIAIE